MTSVEYINSSWFESKFCGRRASSPPIELKWLPIRGQRSGTPLNIHPAWIHFAHRGVATRKPASDRSSGRLFHRNIQPGPSYCCHFCGVIGPRDATDPINIALRLPLPRSFHACNFHSTQFSFHWATYRLNFLN